MTLARHITVVVKVSEACNIACTYCYFYNGADDSYLANPKLLSVDSARDLGIMLRRAHESAGVSSALVILHGGEPLTMKPQRLDALCSTIRGVVGDLDLHFGLTTNAMLVTEEWIQIFDRQRIAVSVSVDGPPEYHDRERVDRRGEGTYGRVRLGIERLAQAAAEGRIPQLSALCVVDSRFDGATAYKHVVHELGFRNLEFLLRDATHDDFDTSSLPGATAYLCSAFDAWIADDDPSINVVNFSKFLAILLQPEAGLNAKIPEVWPVMAVASDGTLGSSDTYQSIDPRLFGPRIPLSQASVELFFARFNASRLNGSMQPTACVECEWLNACGGGQPEHRYNTATGFENVSVYCDTYSSLLTRMQAYAANHVEAAE